MTATLNSTNRCAHCGGVVANAAGKRLTLERLAERHAEVCPGLLRMKRKETS